MLETKCLNLKITDRLKKEIENRAVATGLSEPLPGINWGKWDDEKEDYYSIDFYDRRRLPVEDPVRIIVADGVEFLIIQDWICDDLEGKQFDVIDGRLVVNEQKV